MSGAPDRKEATYGPPADRHPGDCAPFFAADSPALYHTRLDCPMGAAVSPELIRIDHSRLVERLPFW